MKPKYWFLIGAILLSAYMGDMLGRRASVSKNHLKAPNGEESISRSGQQASVADGIPGGMVQTVPPKGSTLRPKPGASGSLPEIASETAKLEILNPARLPIAESGTVDLQEIEERILGEQLAESLRNPAYLRATFDKPSTPIDLGTEEAEEDAHTEEMAGSLAMDGISDEGSEGKLQDESALNRTDADEQLSKADQPAERMLVTDAGVPPSESGAVDPAKIEDRFLNDQLATSLRNPAYLQADLTELPSEATSEENGVD